jgi:hypothetical protein
MGIHAKAYSILHVYNGVYNVLVEHNSLMKM